MNFTTKIEIPHSHIAIDHQAQIMMLGSCFAESISDALAMRKFNIITNPFGILYNPMSIAQSVDRLISGKVFTQDELFFHNGVYQSYAHHGRFSHCDKDICLQNINTELAEASQKLKETNILFITFGTAYVYKTIEANTIVANCHKLPSTHFQHYRLDVSTIVEEWSRIITDLRVIKPNIQIIFTVSPIRHFKDGAHENQLSKSILLLAVDQLCKSSGAAYFPSYEIVLDELRDYRFYKEDMIHPSDMAIRYIWQLFEETYLTSEATQIITQWDKLNAAIRHRPFNEQTHEHKAFLEQTLLKVETFAKKYPYISCDNEVTELRKRIEKLKLD